MVTSIFFIPSVHIWLTAQKLKVKVNICEFVHAKVFLYEYILSAVPPSCLKQEHFHKTLQKESKYNK